MEKLAEALQTAIQMEREGRDTYLSAADQVTDVSAKTVLLELAQDEEEHERLITSYYHALQSHQGWPAPEAEDRPLDLPERVKQMLQEAATRLEHSHTNPEIYDSALESELQARDFYLSQSNTADDRRLIEFFRFLARVEATHAKALELLAERNQHR